MKRILSYFMALSLLFTGPTIGSEKVFAIDNNGVIRSDMLDFESDILDVDKLDTEELKRTNQGEILKAKGKNGWEIIHEKSFANEEGVICDNEMKISEPLSNGFNENGQEVFRRKVEIKTDYYFQETGERLCGLFLAFYFVYDKVNAWVEDNNLMKDQTHIFNKYWKVSANEGIYVAPGQCIVSLVGHLNNRETSLKNLARADESHADIICLANGEIVFRNATKGPKEELDKEGLKFTDFDVKREQVKHNLVREVHETHIEQTRDLRNSATDVYRYIRREVRVIYKDNEGKEVADVILHATFRYNIETHEVTCLSTHNIVMSGDADVLTRTGNETRTYGGAYSEITFTYKTRKGTNKTFVDNAITTCDSMGHVLTYCLNK